TRDSRKSPRLIFEHDGNDVSHCSLAKGLALGAFRAPLTRRSWRRRTKLPSANVDRTRCVSGLQLLRKNHLGQALAALDHRIDVLRLVRDEIEEDQVVLALERFLQCGLDLAGLLHLDADVPIALGELDEVGKRV